MKAAARAQNDPKRALPEHLDAVTTLGNSTHEGDRLSDIESESGAVYGKLVWALLTGGWADVRSKPKEVRWIVLVLQRNKTL